MFQWPDGKRAAVSLTFDDARLSQPDVGIPILDKHGVKATFYVTVGAFDKRIDAWRAAAAHGHEIGNHTLSHRCSGNFPFARAHALEDTSLAWMEQDILAASDAIEQRLGVRPTTFAYPCGNTFVGRGEKTQSYVPLVAKHFVAGRRFYDEAPNDPTFIDMAMITGISADGATWPFLEKLIESTITDARWLVLVSHEVGDEARQTIPCDVLDRLCAYCADDTNGIWCDTVANIGAYVKGHREPC